MKRYNYLLTILIGILFVQLSYSMQKRSEHTSSHKKKKISRKEVPIRDFQELPLQGTTVTIKTYDEKSGKLLRHVIQEYNEQDYYDEYDIEVDHNQVEVEEVYSLYEKGSANLGTIEDGLFEAIENDDIDQAKFLTLLYIVLDYQRPSDGKTCLMVALDMPKNKNWYNLVKLLLDSGASVAPVDNQGKTVFDSIYLKTAKQDPLLEIFSKNDLVLHQKFRDRKAIRKLLAEAYATQERRKVLTF